MKNEYNKISDLANNKFFMSHLKEKIDDFRVLMGEDVEGVDDEEIRKEKIKTHIPKRNQNLKDILILLLQIHKAMQNQQTLEPIAEFTKNIKLDKPSKTIKVKELLENNPEMTDWEISEKAECSIDWVKQLRKAKLIRDELTFPKKDMKGKKEKPIPDDDEEEE